MAKKYVYQKSERGVSDFVYVDLLPEVKRARQFNMNVIIAGTIAVVATYFFIFVPFRMATNEYEEVNGHYNDLQHRLDLKEEERMLHEINLDIINFEQDINQLHGLNVDLNNYLDEINIAADFRGGEVIEVIYNVEQETLLVRVIMINDQYFPILRNDFLAFDWVYQVSSSKKEDYGSIYQVVQYTLEVTPDAE